MLLKYKTDRTVWKEKITHKKKFLFHCCSILSSANEYEE